MKLLLVALLTAGLTSVAQAETATLALATPTGPGAMIGVVRISDAASGAVVAA